MSGYESDSDDRNRYGSLEYLADFQAQISRGRTEHYCHQQTHADRIGSNLFLITGRMHHRNVLFIRAEFAERIFG